jgi:formylglycine-generating enzyme required for sulfatase activity
MKLFISYRSLDSAKVDSIAAKLKAIEEDGQRIYSVWQDKHNIPDGHNWWDAIVDAIIDCDVFIFMVSKESCTSPICQAELRYAFLRNRPIVPIVLEGEYFYDAQTAKNNLRFWDVIPDELNARKAQFLFYEGGSFAQRLANGIKEFKDEPHRWKDKEAKRPVDPRDKDDETSDDVFDIYNMAVDYACRMEFQTAERHFLRLMNSANDTFHHEADKWIDIVRAYNELKKFASRKSTEHRLAKEWEIYQKTYFPVNFINGIFDPFDIAAKVAHTPAKLSEVQTLVPSNPVTPAQPQPASKPARSRKFDILPAPFDWVEIPAGKVTLVNTWDDDKRVYLNKGETRGFDVPAFAIAKYPVTNAQFAKFIDAKGYENKVWWTDAGWEAREQGWYYNGDWKPSGMPWTEPRHWRYNMFNRATQPVVGVSWYEAVAFCLWLSHETGEKVMLPTEQQWQRAAQGDDERDYPWGNYWDSSRCRNSVDKGFVGSARNTSPVTQFEGKDKGDSYFGVVDMAGNVREWCLTSYDNKASDVNIANTRMLRGASWWDVDTQEFLCEGFTWYNPVVESENFGFRISLSY